jgi:hypothetical protein
MEPALVLGSGVQVNIVGDQCIYSCLEAILSLPIKHMRLFQPLLGISSPPRLTPMPSKPQSSTFSKATHQKFRRHAVHRFLLPAFATLALAVDTTYLGHSCWNALAC